jgi:hypothetical protein
MANKSCSILTRLLSGPNQLVGQLHNIRHCDIESRDLVVIGWNMTYYTYHSIGCSQFESSPEELVRMSDTRMRRGNFADSIDMAK